MYNERWANSHEIATRSGPIAFRTADLYDVSIPMREPFRISSGAVSEKRSIVLRLEAEGQIGWGEASAMSGSFYSPETPESCRDELRTLLGQLLDRQFPSMLELENELQHLSRNNFVNAAVETAAWEIIARKRNISLRELFGIEDRPIPSGLAVGLYPTTTELQDALHRYRVFDYQRLKLKIQPGDDIEVVQAARGIVGRFPLFVDANAAYEQSDIPTFLRLEQEELMMFEQPFARHDLDGMAALKSRVRTPICLDESAETENDVERFVEGKACDIVNMKLQRVGGYLPAMRILETCARHHIPVWMGTMPELGIGSAQALMLAAHPQFVYPTDVEPSERWFLDDIIDPPLQLVDGYIHTPSGPGLGFTIPNELLERYTAAHDRLSA